MLICTHQVCTDEHTSQYLMAEKSQALQKFPCYLTLVDIPTAEEQLGGRICSVEFVWLELAIMALGLESIVCVTGDAESLAVLLSAYSMLNEGARPCCLSD